MSANRIFAIVVIYLAAFAGWAILGNITMQRTEQLSNKLGPEVEALWGTELIQEAPSLSVKIPGSEEVRRFMPAENNIRVNIGLDYRKRGLIWYPTYECDFEGTYTVVNPEKVEQKIRLHFDFPSAEATYDAFAFQIDGKDVLAPVDAKNGVSEIIELEPDQTKRFRVAYKTRGMGEWRYRPDRQLGRVRNLNLAVKTDFVEVDYPPDCRSPLSAENKEGGMMLTWTATDLITNQDFGILVPEKLNPGPLVTRITFFAPVCLIFFFTLVGTISIVKKVDIHPMHYLFVASGFFAFHLLLAYMVDHVGIHFSFFISAVVSIALVTGYLRASLGREFPEKIAAAGQVFFLVLFSYTFFLKGMTGLTVAIGSVVTLAILMKVTAHLDWDEVFSRIGNKRLIHGDAGFFNRKPPVGPAKTPESV